jgi:hypothetical protein
MASKVPLSPEGDTFPTPGGGITNATPGAKVVATRDHDAIRGWARRHRADPATGESTSSGPATVTVNDGGAGIRFNFPAAARYRPISWEEWFEHFDAHGLTFVYEEEGGDQAGSSGNDDSFPAAPRSDASAARLARYRLMKEDDLAR